MNVFKFNGTIDINRVKSSNSKAARQAFMDILNDSDMDIHIRVSYTGVVYREKKILSENILRKEDDLYVAF